MLFRNRPVIVAIEGCIYWKQGPGPICWTNIKVALAELLLRVLLYPFIVLIINVSDVYVHITIRPIALTYY